MCSLVHAYLNAVTTYKRADVRNASRSGSPDSDFLGEPVVSLLRYWKLLTHISIADCKVRYSAELVSKTKIQAFRPASSTKGVEYCLVY